MCYEFIEMLLKCLNVLKVPLIFVEVKFIFSVT